MYEEFQRNQTLPLYVFETCLKVTLEAATAGVLCKKEFLEILMKLQCFRKTESDT